MTFLRQQFFKQSPRGIALVLCLVLSGVFCLLNCAAMEVRANSVEESCPMQGHDCCKHRQTSDESEDFAALEKTSSLPPVECCAYQAPFGDLAKKTDAPNVTLVLRTEKIAFQPTIFSAKISRQKFAVVYHSPPIDLNETHLKNCIFRI